MKQTTTEQCGHGYFRKSKAYGLVSGIMLASFFLLSTATASATEVTASSAPTTEVVSDTGTIATEIVTNQATNLAEPQPAPTPEHVQAIAAEGQVVGEAIPVPVESSGLDQAVAGAEAVGVDVIPATEPVVKDNLNEATAELDNQEKKVDEAKETQKQTDAIREENTAKAKKAGVIETPTKAVTYTDNNAAALKDAREQEGRVDVVAEAQIQVNAELPAAVLEAVEAGVAVDGVTIEGNKVVFSKVNRYADVKAGLDDLTKRVADMRAAVVTQTEIDGLIAQAVADMRKAGLVVNVTKAPTSISNLEEVLTIAKNLVNTYADYQKAQENSQQLIADEEIVAKAKGVNVLPGKEDQAKSVKELESKSGAIVGRLTEAGEAADYVAKKEAESKNLANANNLVVSEKAAAPTADIKQAKSAADQDLAEVKAAVETKNKANAELDSHAQKTGATTNLTVIKADTAVTLSTDAVDKHVADEKADMDRAAREALAEQERHNEAVKVQDGTNANINAKAQEVGGHELITVVHTGAKKTALADIPAFEREQIKKLEEAAAGLTATNTAAEAKIQNLLASLSGRANQQATATPGLSYEIGTNATTVALTAKDLEGINSVEDLLAKYPELLKVERQAEPGVAAVAGTPSSSYETIDEVDKERYDRELAEYQKALDEYLALVNQDGYVLLEKGQGMQFVSEPNAKITQVQGNFTSFAGTDEGWGGLHVNIGKPGTTLPDALPAGQHAVFEVVPPYVVGGHQEDTGTKVTALGVSVKKGESVKVTHSLNDTFINGVKATTLVRTWTLNSTPSEDGTSVALIYEDPTLGIYFGSSRKHSDGTFSMEPTWWGVTNTFYDAQGNEIALDSEDTRAYWGVGSLNYSHIGDRSISFPIQEQEGVRVVDGKGYVLNGSSVGVARSGQDLAPGTLYAASSSNHHVEEGSPYNRADWDGPYETHPLAYYGAVVLESNSNTLTVQIENNPFLIGDKNPRPTQRQWSQLTSQIFTASRPTPPQPAKTKIVTVDGTPGTPGKEAVSGLITLGTVTFVAEPITVEYSTVAVDSVVKSYEVTYTPVNLPVELNPQQIEVESGKVTLNVDVVTPVVGASVEGIQYTVPTHDVIIATTVKPVVIEQKPTNVKAVFNTEEQDINGKSVAKGASVSWATGGETLKAGRPQFSALTREDFLAPGQTVDMEKTVASSDKITFTYNAKTHSILQAFKASVLAEANLDQTKAFILPEGRIYTTVLNDGATYENTFTTTFEYADSVIIDKDGKITKTGEVKTYKTTSNKVVITTPTKSQPEKHIYTKDGQQIDGKSVLPNTELYYTARYELAKHKGVVATQADIEAGFAFFDDPQDSTVQFHFDRGVWGTAAGQVMENVFTRHEFDSLDAVKDEKLKALIAKSGFKPAGNFGAWLPTDPAKFYADYVVTGTDLFLTFPISTGNYTGTFKNTVHQVVFGNGYAGNIVENNIPKLEAIKDVLKSIGSGESIANGLVALGQEFPYKLDLPAVPKNLAGGLNKVHALDDFDERYDEYNGEYYSFADSDMKRKDGSVVKLGDELTRYWVQNIKRDENGKAIAVEYTIDKAFLDSLADDELFDATIYPIMKRIAYGENIENTLIVFVNDIEVSRSTVKTNTPKPTPPAPEVPVQPVLPSTPTPAPTPVPAPQPQPSGPRLPETGDASGILMTAAGALTSLMGLIGFGKRKENN